MSSSSSASSVCSIIAPPHQHRSPFATSPPDERWFCHLPSLHTYTGVHHINSLYQFIHYAYIHLYIHRSGSHIINHIHINPSINLQENHLGQNIHTHTALPTVRRYLSPVGPEGEYTHAYIWPGEEDCCCIRVWGEMIDVHTHTQKG